VLLVASCQNRIPSQAVGSFQDTSVKWDGELHVGSRHQAMHEGSHYRHFLSQQSLMNKKLQFFVILSTDGVARSLSVQPRSSGRRRETSRAAVDHRLSKLQSHSGPQEWVLAGCFIANRCLITYCTPLLLYIYVPWLTDLLNLLQFTLQHTHTHTRLTAVFPGLPGWADTRKVKPIWILLLQETMSGSGISWAICPSCHPTNSVKALKA